MSEVYQEASEKYRVDPSKIYISSWPNKTHALRKLYASYSHFVYARTSNQNVWIKDVLGHTSIETSFNYANMVVSTHARSNFLIQEWNLLKKAVRDLASLVENGDKVIRDLDECSANFADIDDEDDNRPARVLMDDAKNDDDGNDDGWNELYTEYKQTLKK